MEKTLIRWQAAGFLFVCSAGTLLHFLYGWSGENPLNSVIAAVNESTWEHMKLLYVPLFVFALVQSRYFRDVPAFWCVKLRGTLTGLVLIPVLFYTYNGMFGKSPDWVNIAIFYVAAGVAFLFEWWAFRKNLLDWKYPQLALGALVLMGVLFVVFTFSPPQLPLFQDPVTGEFGI